MPAPGSTVAAMMSGGLDTTVVIGLLLKKYKLNIIPFYFERYWPGDDNSKTLSAAQEIFSLYQREYPNQLEDLNILTSFFPSKEVVVDLEKIVWEEISAKKTKNVKGMPFELDFFIQVIITYLRTYKREEVKTVFLGINVNDTRYLNHHRLTALRALMLQTCVELNDFDWQISSLPIEETLGFFLDKNDLLEIGNKNNFPIFESVTCRKGNRFHCGICPLCAGRKEAFLKTHIKDQTIYESERSDLIGHLKKKNKVLNRILKKL